MYGPCLCFVYNRLSNRDIVLIKVLTKIDKHQPDVQPSAIAL